MTRSRADPQVVVINVDLSYQGKQGQQTTFNVNSVVIEPLRWGGEDLFIAAAHATRYRHAEQHRCYGRIPGNGQHVRWLPQQDLCTGRPGGLPGQPVPIISTVFVPYIRPIPFFSTGAAPGTIRFMYGTGFRSFYDMDRVPHTRRPFLRITKYPRYIRPRNTFSGQGPGTTWWQGSAGASSLKAEMLVSSVSGGISGYRGGVEGRVLAAD